jgi:TP901 family phage tail tape measure protein
MGGFSANATIRIKVILQDAATKALQAVENTTGSLGSKMMTLGSRIRSAGQSLTIGLTTPIVLLGAAIVKTFTQFDDALAKTVALTSANAEQVAIWREQILELAPAVGKSPRELADALFVLASSGLKVTEVMPVMEAAAKASAAGLGSTTTVSLAATSAINAYRDSHLTAADAMGVMIRAVDQGRTETDQLAEVYGRILPLSSELGVTFQDVNGALAAMSLINEDANENSTQLIGIMKGLLRPTKAGREALDAIGTSAQILEQRIGEKGLLPVLMELREKFQAKFGDQWKAELSKVMPRMEGFIGFLNLTGDNVEKVNAVFKNVAGGGAADLERAFLESQTAGFRMRQAMASVEVLLIRLGDVAVPILADAMKEFVPWIEKAVDFFTGLPGPVQKALIFFALFLAVLGPILILVGSLIALMGAVAMAFGTSVVVVGLVASVIGIVIVAIIALIVGAILLWKNWDAVTAFMGEAVDWLKDKFWELVDDGQAVFGRLSKLAWDKMQEFGEAIREKLFDARDALKQFGLDIKNDLRKRFDALVTPVEDAFIEIEKTVSFYFELAKDTVRGFMDFLDSDFGRKLVEVITLPTRMTLSALVGLFRLTFNIVRTILAAAFNIYRILFMTWLNVTITIVKAAFDILKTILTTQFTIWKAVFLFFMSLFGDIILVGWTLIKNYVLFFLNIITGIIRVVMALIRGDWDAAWKAVKDTVSKEWALIKDTVTTVIGAIERTLTNAWETIKTTAATAWGGIKDVILTALRAMRDVGGTILEGFKNIFVSALNSIINLINDFAGGINSVSGAISKVSKLFGGDAIPSIPKIPPVSLAVGAANIPRKMLALLHPGEMVIPKPFADSVRGAGGGLAAPVVVNLNIAHLGTGVTESDVDALVSMVERRIRSNRRRGL